MSPLSGKCPFQEALELSLTKGWLRDRSTMVISCYVIVWAEEAFKLSRLGS